MQVKYHYITGITNKYTLTPDFFNSADYQTLAALQREVSNLLDKDAYVQRGEKKKNITLKSHATLYIM